MKDKKKILIGTLCALIMIMAVGYALLSQQLSINGTANITSTWKIEITNITEKERHGGVTEKSKSYDAMTANFDVGFTSPGDYITYDVEVTNSGTLDAVIERINVVTNDNPAIIYTTMGIEEGDIIERNTKKYLTVKIEYDSSVTSQPQTNNNALTLQLFSAQNLGQMQPEYDTYSVGDKITFAGYDWYVIKNSTADEDYVTLMKETVLNYNELGNYAFKIKCTSNHVQYRNYGCTEIGQTKPRNTMAFYWSSTCHGGSDHIYGQDNYENTDTSGCLNHNNFEGSKIKEYLDNVYSPNIDFNSTKLKEVDGYKIRLITKEELQNNLGWSELNKYATDSDNSLVPTWVYQNYGEDINEVFGYWTMTPAANSSTNVWGVNKHTFQNGKVVNDYSGVTGVRPVINLLKSAIE